MKPYRIAIFFSGLKHSLAGSKYNMRVEDELRAGGYALQAFAGFEYGKLNQAKARHMSVNFYRERNCLAVICFIDGKQENRVQSTVILVVKKLNIKQTAL